MADTKIDPDPTTKKHGLGGSKDAELEGINASEYDVFATDKNLSEAQTKYPNIVWFACFSVKDKSGQYANISYTLKFDKPASGTLYYYLNGKAHQLSYEDTDDKKGKKRVKATLTVGDPPVGMG